MNSDVPRRIVRIERTKQFLKQYKKLSIKLQDRTTDKLEEFASDQFAQQLNNHALSGEYLGYRSINITGDVRALYYLRTDGTVVVFAFIGTHSQLYG